MGDEDGRTDDPLFPQLHQESGGKTLGTHIQGGSNFIGDDELWVEDGGR